MIYPNTKVTAAQTVTRQVTASEAAVLRFVLNNRAAHACELTGQEEIVRRLLALGLLHCRTTRIGQIICMSPQGNVQMNQPEMRLVAPSVSANIVYHRAATNMAQENGYQFHSYINAQTSLLVGGQMRHLMLINANTSGPSSDTIKRSVYYLETHRIWGNMIIVTDDIERYNYHVKRQQRLVIWKMGMHDLSIYLKRDEN